MYFVYILKSEVNNQYYIGYCSDLDRRLKRHNKGYVESTKRYKPWQLVHKEEKNTEQEAILREQQLKSWKSRAAIERLINNS